MVLPLGIQNKQGNNSSSASYVSTYNKKSSYSLEYIKLMETRNPIVVNAPPISNL